jgi:hypothetical protein
LQDAILEWWRQELATAHPEEAPGRALEHPPVGRDEQRLVEAALLRQPPGEHVGGVGERLEVVEHPRRRVRDRGHPRGGEPLRERLDDEDACAAAREDDPQQPFHGAGGLEQRFHLAAQRGEVGLQPEPVAGALDPRVVVFHREGPAAVEAGDLEGTVAAQQSFVGDRDPRVLRRADHAVQGGERHRARCYRAGALVKRSGSNGAGSMSGGSPHMSWATSRPVTGPSPTAGALVARREPQAPRRPWTDRSPEGGRASTGAGRSTSG